MTGETDSPYAELARRVDRHEKHIDMLIERLHAIDSEVSGMRGILDQLLAQVSANTRTVREVGDELNARLNRFLVSMVIGSMGLIGTLGALIVQHLIDGR